MRFSVWLTLAPVLAALPALAEPVPLAAGGQPRATLVVEPNADPSSPARRTICSSM